MNKINKFVYWVPRILSIVFMLFLAMFSLDIFEGNYGFWGTILGLFMHNLPVIILTIFLIISWRYEIVGGIIFILAGLLYILLMTINVFKNQLEFYMLSYSLIIAGPAFIISYLFLLGWNKKTKNKNPVQ